MTEPDWLGDPVSCARGLLGATLVAHGRRARIVETEAYAGEDDHASHSFRGPTPRSAAMYGPPGIAYVYFVYGAHWMLNVVAGPPGIPGAALIRAVAPLEPAEWTPDRLRGPGKLCAALGIDGGLNGANLFDPDGDVRIEPGPVPPRIVAGPRVGIRPGAEFERLWRFVDADAARWISRPLPPAVRLAARARVPH